MRAMFARDSGPGQVPSTSWLTRNKQAHAAAKQTGADRRMSGRALIKRMLQPTISEYTRGALCGFAAVCIWAGFIVVSRLGVRTSLTPWDIAAIRFAVAGSLLLPYALRKGLAFRWWCRAC
jgi:drug/metabolite transporter (DMT)-like permease